MERTVTPVGAPEETLVADTNGLVHVGGDGTARVEQSLGSLLRMRSDDLRHVLSAQSRDRDVSFGPPVAPVHPTLEVWAAGVTYEVSRSARIAESGVADVYAKVYDAERPELFFKAPGWRVCGPDAPVGIRADSTWSVPEPELALVCNAFGEIVGYTVCNDMSSRSIEGENPLYLPQAKCYRGSCALGPWIRLAWAVPDPYALDITVRIERDREVLWRGETSTGRLHRRLDELVGALYAGDTFPYGVVLATGTSAVPPESVTLQSGDRVVIGIDEIGELENPVLQGVTEFAPIDGQEVP